MSTPEVIIAGHLTMDFCPTLEERHGDVDELIQPGKTVFVGPAAIAAGGAVGNTGAALSRLGVPAALVANTGSDALSSIVEDLVRKAAPLASIEFVRDAGSSSYTLVINPPGTDRAFLHYDGPNAGFTGGNVTDDLLMGKRLIHFGYPSVLPRMCAENGRLTRSLMERAKGHGLTTSMDMSMPDPQTEAGQLDWRRLLEDVLPWTDVFLPTLPETMLMLHREEFDSLCKEMGHPEFAPLVKSDRIAALAQELIDMGVGIAGIKLGDDGIYLRTTSSAERLEQLGACAPTNIDAWLSRQLMAPCFKVSVQGTTGAGDCTIAGFLAGLLRGASPEQAITMASAVGACSVEGRGAVAGILDWDQTAARVESGWERLPSRFDL
jgi:sugar/nucleoside kinase (ribokinase family)